MPIHTSTPKVRLGDYSSLQVAPVHPRPISEDDIVREIEVLREQASQTARADREAQAGDLVTLDFITEAGDTATGVTVMLGAGSTAPGFEEQLVGARVGETRMVTLEHLTLTAKILAVDEKQRPDDERLADVHHTTVPGLRIRAADTAQDAENLKADAMFRSSALDVVAERSEVEMRPAHVAAALGVPVEELDEQTGETRAHAAQTIRREAVLAAIIRAEGIRPTDSDLKRSELVKGWARAAKRHPQGIVGDYRRDGKLDELRHMVAKEMALDVLVNATQQRSRARDTNSSLPTGDTVNDA